ncbi:MAG: putative zinc-binding metallopeptidase [Pseudomonadota bacterium]
MKVGRCVCGNSLFFTNTICSACGRSVGFLPDSLQMSALEPIEGGYAAAQDAEAHYTLCQNQVEHAVCNWLLPATEAPGLCASCRLNHTIPDLSVPQNLAHWGQIEQAKRHALYSLLRLGLLLISKLDDEERGLAFDFLADKDPNSEFTEPLPGQEPVLTGHDNGLITLNVAEADPVARTRNRLQMGENYRTLLGHFRHELGHYYWDRLIAGTPLEAPFRESFGDERADYGEALSRHYEQGPVADWPQHFVSAYASSHPWEDWAETWAHFLHMVDTMETAADFGLIVRRIPGDTTPDASLLAIAPGTDFAALMDQWLSLSVLTNALNRSMGLDDAYPFVLTPAVRAKLQFIHDAVKSQGD